MDSIIECTSFTRPNGKLDRYEVMFSIEGIENPVSVTVFSNEMLVPTSLDELKTKACAKASLVKANSLMQTQDIPDLDGEVSL